VNCVFCGIAEGSSHAWRLYEDAGAVAFLDIAPTRRGHTLLIPKVHVPDVMADGADTALAAMATGLHVVGRALVSRLNADGLSVFQSNGEASGQEVFHLHVHLVPRRLEDGRLTVWERDELETQRLEETHALVRPGVS
jgi:histidine triad (HIT) family protein